MPRYIDDNRTSEGSDQESRPFILEGGFRPFFLGAAILAACAVPLWIAAFSGYLRPSLGNTGVGSASWHVHEMLFGYLSAVLTGFLFTAIPNWTGRLPLKGMPLAALFAFWLAGRLAVALEGQIGTAVASVIDGPFLVIVTAMIFREIVAGKNWRNLPVCVLVGLFATANIFFWIDLPTLDGAAGAWRLAIAVAALLIGLIGGRVTPSFTRNWLKKQNLPQPASFGPSEKFSLIVLALALLVWVARPNEILTGWLAILAGALHFLRLVRWRVWDTLAEPLVTILHLGYLWLPTGLVILGLGILGWDALGNTAALHALSAGAIGTMTLAVMTRATLGHTGRPLKAGWATVAIYAFIVLGGVLRVTARVLPFDYLDSIAVAGALWSAAFALFVLVYGPMLARRGK